jgi:hypothetical protein
MRARRVVRASALLLALVACSDTPSAPTPPRALRALTSTAVTSPVAAPVPGGITVEVVDYSDRPVEGVKVAFRIVAGDGSIGSTLVLSDDRGQAHTDWTLGETAGENEVVASIFGVDSTTHFVATATPGPAFALAITPRVVRIPASASAALVTARVVDQYGNAVAGTPSYTSRNAAVVTVNGSGLVSATEPNPNNRAGSTYIVVTVPGFKDSAAVFTLSPTDPPCTGIAAMAPLAIGGIQVAGFSDNGICVPAAAGDREYALVPFFDSPAPSAQTVLTITGVGIKTTASASLGAVHARDADTGGKAAAAFDERLRVNERREIGVRALAAREWYGSRMSKSAGGASLATVARNVGDFVQLNIEPDSFCSHPVMRTGRVVAVTNKAVVIADTLNPAGYSDADYASFGATFDTLAYQVDVVNFGAPTDIDENGRVLVFFTHSVNEAGFGVLGYAYARDLLPRSGPIGSCPGSNLAEMLYIRVPDGALPSSSARLDVGATMAHELQHVINASRRLYINQDAAPVEEVWLNEGLSHVAEELAFYRASGLSPRQNLGTQLSSVASAFREYAFRNFERYFVFTSFPGTQGPLGLTDADDDAETRGAAWSFLRFAADQRAAANEAGLWQSLVNSNSTGTQNLADHLGADWRLLVRDWAVSNYVDDLVPADSKYSQLSWNLRQVPGFHPPSVVDLLAANQTAPTTATAVVTLRALSAEFVRFAVGANQEGYIGAAGFPASANSPLPRHVLLAIVRTK